MRGGLAAGLAVFVMVLGGCTAEDDSPDSAEGSGPDVIVPEGPGEEAGVVPGEQAAEHAPETAVADADVDYMLGMIPHHEQALVMTELVPERADSAKVKSIAERIEVTQDGEIGVMRSWLDQYAQGADPGQHGHGGQHGLMPGMATPEQLDALRAAEGEEFDRLFCELMITHHEGALTMAEDYLPDGLEPRALAMAQEVVTTQNAEIEHLREMTP
ncbi:DUF305 domain-containing protein [Saccharomonospora piscinae]|uniref:DUF305 domain-containing protein n=1 Tax=Saccharomonospora piscinae TaxID=687388 RepID=A0A1V8ZXF9_SACPI|nr:DUF305 domain-containing protein [Saccharomonospora piscinae]OQO89453.1 DUF305 domain-containing protein [Saccharomonospora piscinae]